MKKVSLDIPRVCIPDDYLVLTVVLLCCCRLTNSLPLVILKLKAIGIPADALPVTEDSKLLVQDHLEWIANLKKFEEETEVWQPPSKKSRAEREIKSDDFNPESISMLCKSSQHCYTVG